MKKPTQQRSPRSDGEKTKSLLLDCAGNVFAHKGYADATSKEICDLAGANSSAINYYFGSKESLYEHVLIEAHKKLIDIDDLKKIESLVDRSPEEKLEAIISLLFKTSISSSDHWKIKVFLRELASPTHSASAMINKSVIPKSIFIKKIISKIIGGTPESAEVQRATALVILPCISLILFPEKLRSTVLPATSNESPLMYSDLIRYIFSGLNSLKNTH